MEHTSNDGDDVVPAKMIQRLHNQHGSKPLDRNKLFGNRLLYLISAFIVVVVGIQWRLATHHIQDLSTKNSFRSSLDSFVGKRGIRKSVTSNSIDRYGNVLSRIYSAIEDVLPDEHGNAIPTLFTHVDEQYLHNGRVVRELSHRVLSRNIAQSNVMIVSPNFQEAHVYEGSKHSADADMYYPAKKAMEQGHTTHLLPSNVNFGDGWIDVSSKSRYNSSSVGWILLAYFATQSFDPIYSSPTIDEILSPSVEGVESWLKHTTVTYIVFPIKAIATVQLSSILTDEEYEYEMDYTVNKIIEMVGLEAAHTLLRSHYKLQLLASSHYFDASKEDTFYYGPNALFQNVKQLHRFLHQRITEVLTAEVRHLRKRRHKLRLTAMENQILEVQFHSLIFATQGLDLAIPSRFSYLDVGNHSACKDDNGNRKKKCDPKLHQRAQGNTIFLECPKRHSSVKVKFARQRLNNIDYIKTKLERTHNVAIDIKGTWLNEEDIATGEIEVWSGHEDPDKSEAFCVKTDKSSLLPSVACTTRIVPAVEDTSIPPNKKTKLMGEPNLLVVMIDPLSRQQLKRSLAHTWAIMDLLGFIDFAKYTAVGKNSGPNQVALYSGAPLFSRDIRSSSNATERIWIWDRLRDAGYITMKAEDGCVSNSNMMQSIDPQTHHGKQLNEMFCFSYDRPNCLGEELVAAHLVNYTMQFITTYSREEGKTSATAKPWAAFISFVDSHEDTSTLVSYLDTLLVDFLQAVIAMANPMNPTMIVFTSDHGLHYGPTLESMSGMTEQVQPLLMMRLPSFSKNTHSQIKKNADLFTTPFDVHETILDSLLDTSTTGGSVGASLLKALPRERSKCETTAAIPAHFCSVLEQNHLEGQNHCTFLSDPPSIASFYSSIPQTNRPSWPDQCPLKRNHSNEVDGEHCVEFLDSSYTLRSCGQHNYDKSSHLTIHVTRDEEFVQERKALSAKSRSTNNQGKTEDLPNIIFLEIDSVSLSSSQRFFPQTWSLLEKHRIVNIGEGVNSCPTGWCAAALNKTSVVGQSSIVNQLAALSGCINQKDSELTFFNPSTYCYNAGSKKSTKGDHWIFDIAKRLGYITFFGEEFCYEDSPYVVQTQTAFTLDVDLSPSKLFCDLAREWIRFNGEVNSKTVHTFEVDYDDKIDSCFDGTDRGEIAFTYISQMFEQYSDMPKFAFINALAAHDYSLNAAHSSLSAENYDTTVLNFLTNMMSKTTDRPTFIILRSDHGLQGGPYPVDYSTQIEHLHPWTAIIAPASHTGISLQSLASNQNRLVTGFDIYNSIRYLMSSSEDNSDAVGIPPWSYNILKDSIPADRTCQNARIPVQFCPCNAERNDMVASFYIGHSEQSHKYTMPILLYNWQIHRFVAKRPPGSSLLKLDAKYSVKPNTAIMIPNCNVTLGSYIQEDMLKDSWEMIESIAAMYPGSDVSGGIYLYPRQTILISYLIQKEMAFTKQKSKKSKQFRICETGFGSGHSAALFLAASPDVEVVSFDLFDRPYQLASVHALNAYFGNRLKTVQGDSCKQVKRYSSKCDFLHGSSLCSEDNIELIHKSGAGVTLTSTAMDSLQDKSVYFGKRLKREVKKYGENAQWATLHDKGCIEKMTCFDEESRTLDANLILARGKEQTISHKFCFAVNTGKCSSSDFSTRESSWRQEDFCPDWRISITN